MMIKARLALLTTTIFWGTSFVLIRDLTTKLSGETLLSFRLLIGALVIYLFAKLIKHAIVIPNFKQIMISGVLLFGVLYSTTFALENGLKAANAAFFTGFGVVLVGIFEMIKQKKINLFNLLLVFISFIGITLLIGFENINFNSKDLYGLLISFTVAAQVFYLAQISPSNDSISLALFMLLVALGVIIVVGISKNSIGLPEIALTKSEMIQLAVISVISTGIAFLVQTIAQKQLSASETALILNLEPVFGLIFASIIPNQMGEIEKMTILNGIGASLIFLSMLLSEIDFQKIFKNQGGK